jgi:hypothetical protein
MLSASKSKVNATAHLAPLGHGGALVSIISQNPHISSKDDETKISLIDSEFIGGRQTVVARSL